MATRPGVSEGARKALEAANQHIVFAVEALFDTDPVRLHSAVGELEIDGETYTGAGTLIGIGDIEDTRELKSSGMTFIFSGLDKRLIGYAQSENYQNRLITLRAAFMAGAKVGETIILYRGRMQKLSMTDDPDGATVTIQTENRLADLRRPSNIRYTNEAQNALHPGDTGLAMVAALADTEIPWGNRASRRVGGGGGDEGAGGEYLER